MGKETSNASLRNSDKYKINPFIEKTVEAVSEHTVVQKRFARSELKNKAAIVNASTGELVGETALMTFKTVDNEQFAKVYTRGVAKWSGMTPSTAVVFEYILNELKPDRDTVMVYEPVFLEENNGISKNSFYRAVGWLIKNEFIAKTVFPNVYYINPTLFFNGSRLALVEVWETEEATKQRIDRFKQEAQLKLF